MGCERLLLCGFAGDHPRVAAAWHWVANNFAADSHPGAICRRSRPRAGIGLLLLLSRTARRPGNVRGQQRRRRHPSPRLGPGNCKCPHRPPAGRRIMAAMPPSTFAKTIPWWPLPWPPAPWCAAAQSCCNPPRKQSRCGPLIQSAIMRPGSTSFGCHAHERVSMLRSGATLPRNGLQKPPCKEGG